MKTLPELDAYIAELYGNPWTDRHGVICIHQDGYFKPYQPTRCGCIMSELMQTFNVSVSYVASLERWVAEWFPRGNPGSLWAAQGTGRTPMEAVARCVYDLAEYNDRHHYADVLELIDVYRKTNY